MTSSKRQGFQVISDEEVESELQFHDFSEGPAATLLASSTFDDYPEGPSLNAETEELLKPEEQKPKSFWEFSYYQSFFDVNTNQVLQRILWSMIPLPGRATFLDRQIRPPDLYGPFWIATTLVFTTAISANIAEFIMTQGQDNKIWHYDFHKVSLAATAIYSYAFLLPLAVWGLMWYRKSSTKYTLLEILCIYGYSLFIYIPISILWVIQVTWLQWLLVLIGASLSGLVLLQTFLPVVKDENCKISCVILFLIMLFHVLLAVGFVTYFFQPAYEKSSSPIEPVHFGSSTSSALKTLSSLANKTVTVIVPDFTQGKNVSLNSTKHM